MKNIGIELDNIVRDINGQLLKYYIKDIDKEFDEKSIDLNKSSFINDLPFKNKSSKNEFVFIDYPYEIFGCGKTMENNLSVKINNWYLDLIDKGGYDVSFFSLRENDLSIPSTYYFLSKIATRIRKMFFPFSNKDVWKVFDIIITTDKEIVKNKPKGKIVILIEKSDNIDVKKNADYSCKLLSEVFDYDIINKIKSNEKKKSIFSKIKKIFN